MAEKRNVQAGRHLVRTLRLALNVNIDIHILWRIDLHIGGVGRFIDVHRASAEAGQIRRKDPGKYYTLRGQE